MRCQVAAHILYIIYCIIILFVFSKVGAQFPRIPQECWNRLVQMARHLFLGHDEEYICLLSSWHIQFVHCCVPQMLAPWWKSHCLAFTHAEVVTYKPTEYGKPVQGKLIIQTEETPFVVWECKEEKHILTYWIKMDAFWLRWLQRGRVHTTCLCMFYSLYYQKPTVSCNWLRASHLTINTPK